MRHERRQTGESEPKATFFPSTCYLPVRWRSFLTYIQLLEIHLIQLVHGVEIMPM
jgi:hypothetical protein